MTQIFRITHYKNLPYILRNGLHSPNSEIQDPDFEPIGFPTLIHNREERLVTVPPEGTLADYIPFYFWYKSPMLYVIHKGNDPEVINTPQEEIVYLVSSFEQLQQNNCRFVFTDRHAMLDYANFYTNTADIDKLNWEIIKGDNWGRQYGPERREMKQAECLVFKHLPFEAIIGIAVKSEMMFEKVTDILTGFKNKPAVKIKPNFYF